MSADQLSRISPDHSLLSGDLLLSFEGELPHIMIYEKFVNFVPKQIIFKQKLCRRLCRGFEVKGRKSWGRANTPFLSHLF